ncbi:hypothetical protein F2Q69_00025211 [Brassica cretica]|uniref:Uncharacterized protein n=1 Tax=Brassica cretica TaxID=69181 RepID=A0A8S9Q667_BRACR|nr:hypothetical protein F2Q69_00025211 [Brassica cretica]
MATVKDMGCKELKLIASTRARDGDFEDPEIAEEVATIAGRYGYKRRSEVKSKDTLKTLERATPILRPCFHPALDPYF